MGEALRTVYKCRGGSHWLPKFRNLVQPQRNDALLWQALNARMHLPKNYPIGLDATAHLPNFFAFSLGSKSGPPWGCLSGLTLRVFINLFGSFEGLGMVVREVGAPKRSRNVFWISKG